MAAFVDLADYLDAVAKPIGPSGSVVKSVSGSLLAGRLHSSWTMAPPTVTAPSTAVAPTSATVGAIDFSNNAGGSQFIVSGSVSNRQLGVYILADRLSHQGGLSGTSNAAQTTNLPTAALTRYTSGVGVFAGLEIYTDIGTTQTTVSISYTNQAGTTGRTSPSVLWGGTGNNTAWRIIQVPLMSGDSGVRAVASVTAAATTGTLGNFGVVLYKPLLYIPSGVVDNFDLFNRMLGGLPDLPSDSCLFWLFVPSLTAAASPHCDLNFVRR